MDVCFGFEFDFLVDREAKSVKTVMAKGEKEPLDWPWRDLLGSAYKKAGHAADLMRMNVNW